MTFVLDTVAESDSRECVGVAVPELVALSVPAPLLVGLDREERLPVADTVEE